MTQFLLFILAISVTFILYYILCLVLTRQILDYYNKLRSSPDFLNKTSNIASQNVKNIEPPSNSPSKNRIVINTGKKFEFANRTPLKAFANAYDRTLHAIEEQKFEDWLDAIEKIFKMLKKDFFGTIKNFFKFLVNISKPIDKNDFETRMANINAQRQQLEVDKMVTKLQENMQDQTLRLDASENLDLPTNINKISTKFANNNQLKPIKTVIRLKPSLAEDDIEIKTEEIEESELNEFQKVEQRLLLKLKEIGVGNYDLWLDLAELYSKNNSITKAKEIYTYVAKNAKDKNKQRAINNIIGLD
jgi:hypothetical protein